MNEYINKEDATIYYTVYWWCKLQNPENKEDATIYSFIRGANAKPAENHRPVTSH